MQNKIMSTRTLLLRGKIVDWLSAYLLESKKEGYILGLSGGVDSAVIALLAKEAVERANKKLFALILPINNDYYDEEMAVSICNQFNIDCKVINMGTNYDLLKATINNTASRPIVYTNLKARLRECAIYYYANNNNYLVLGTVNKGEFTIGYFPKNATAGDLLPIADLLKNEIRDIGRSYGLPEEIVQRKASGCIWASTAEEEWGFTEEELDAMLIALGQSEDAVMRLPDIPAVKKERFLVLYHESRHKRAFYPIYKKGK